jgi:hypothetical protein
MRKRGSAMLKLLVTAGLLAVAGLVLIKFGVGLPAIFLSVFGLAALWWWFIRKLPPEGELPCASVSCCHYLGDQKERTQQPQ